MTVYRDNVNITKKSDKELAHVIAKLTSLVSGHPQFEERIKWSRISCGPTQMSRVRPMVREFLAIYSVAYSLLTKTTHYAPSPETALWDSFEGGHTHNEHPDMRAIIGW